MFQRGISKATTATVKMMKMMMIAVAFVVVLVAAQFWCWLRKCATV